MIVSFFQDGFCTEIDYTDRDGCLLVAEVSEADVELLRSGMDFRIAKGKLEIYEGEKWQAVLAKREEEARLARESRKQEIRKQLGELANELQGVKLLGESTEAIEAQIASLTEEYKTL